MTTGVRISGVVENMGWGRTGQYLKTWSMWILKSARIIAGIMIGRQALGMNVFK